MNCAPHRKGDTSCYTKEQLVKMAKNLNEKESSKIKLTGTKDELWNAIRMHLFDECDYEWEWMDNKTIKKLNDREIKYETFKPPMPTTWLKNKFTWLTTTDILNVMRQYEKLYREFKFFGPVPVDCPKDIYCELTNINLEKMSVIIKPVISEKMTAQGDKFNRYGFVVSKDANKVQVKNAVEKLYSVTVDSVKISL